MSLWSDVDVSRQDAGVLGLPIEIAETLYGGSAVVRKYFEPALSRFVVGKRVVVYGRPLLEVLREPQIQQQLKHKHLVPIITVADVLDPTSSPPTRIRNEVELITPYYSGGSVFDALLDRRSFDVAEALDVVRAAALGLAELHRERILHRDMKSPNVFLTDDDSMARVGDLGEAQEMDDEGRAPGLDSATPWIAPEQIASNLCTTRSDLFGLGVMLVELLNGGLDIAGYDRKAAHARMSQGRTALPRRLMEPPPWAPPSIRTLIRQLTHADPDHRPASATRVADRLAIRYVVGWTKVSSHRWEGTARHNNGRYAVAFRHLPRLGRWESRIEREGTSGWRALEVERHSTFGRSAIEDRLDRAISLSR